MAISRRDFFKQGGLIAGGAVAGAAVAIPLARNNEPKEVRPDIKENQVILPANGKSVVIVGGGPSGLQAGVELAARGFKVTLLEKSGAPGGKLKSWRDKSFGPSDDPEKLDPAFPGYIREHGVHGLWGFYHNLYEFLARYGWQVAEQPDDLSIYHYRDRDGTDSFLPNLNGDLQLLNSILNFNHFSDDDRSKLLRLMRKLFSFDYSDQKQREYLDSMTFEDYMKQLGCYTPGLVKFFDSFAEITYFDNVDKVSALCIANVMMLVSGPSDFNMTFYRNPTAETLLKPMADFIRNHGGEIHYYTEVDGIEMAAERIAKVKARPVPREAIKRCSICGALIFAGMEVGGECPYCGANADMLCAIKAYERHEREFAADYYICAMDGVGAQTLVAKNIDSFGHHGYFKKVIDLDSKSVFVCNLWFDGKGYWEKSLTDPDRRPSPVMVCTGFSQLSTMINRSVRIKGKDGKQWAWSTEYADRNVTVIETQIAKAEKISKLWTAEIAELCYQEMKTMMPDLPKPKAWYVNRWTTFTSNRVGEVRKKPLMQSPIDNLLFIGDIALLPQLKADPVGIEKCNVTAKLVTNLLLDKIGQKEGKITILPSSTPGLSSRTLALGQSVFLADAGAA